MSRYEDECFGSRKREGQEGPDWVGLFNVGFFLILIGVIFLITPSVLDNVVNFVKSFTKTTEIYAGIFLPTPSGNNTEVYRAAMYFCFSYGVFQIVMLILRFATKSSIHKKAEALGGIVFWLGAGVIENMLVISGNDYWPSFIGGLIVLIGLLIIVRALATFFARQT
jgi:hypothetical protein